jgi:hypothetical protein
MLESVLRRLGFEQLAGGGGAGGGGGGGGPSSAESPLPDSIWSLPPHVSANTLAQSITTIERVNGKYCVGPRQTVLPGRRLAPSDVRLFWVRKGDNRTDCYAGYPPVKRPGLRVYDSAAVVATASGRGGRRQPPPSEEDCVGHLLTDTYFQGTVDEEAHPGWIKLCPCFVKYEQPVNQANSQSGPLKAATSEPADLGERDNYRASPPSSPTGSCRSPRGGIELPAQQALAGPSGTYASHSADANAGRLTFTCPDGDAFGRAIKGWPFEPKTTKKGSHRLPCYWMSRTVAGRADQKPAINVSGVSNARGVFAGANALSTGTTVLFREVLRKKGSAIIGPDKKGRVLDCLEDVYVPWHNASESGANADVAYSGSGGGGHAHVVEEFYNVPENGARLSLSVLQKLAAAKRRQLDREEERWRQEEAANARKQEANDQVWGRRVEKARASAAIKQRAAFNQKEKAVGRKEFLTSIRTDTQKTRSKSVHDAKVQTKKVAAMQQTTKKNIVERKQSMKLAIGEERNSMRQIATDFAPANSPNSPKSSSPLTCKKSGIRRQPSLLDFVAPSGPGLGGDL